MGLVSFAINGKNLLFIVVLPIAVAWSAVPKANCEAVFAVTEFLSQLADPNAPLNRQWLQVIRQTHPSLWQAVRDEIRRRPDLAHLRLALDLEPHWTQYPHLFGVDAHTHWSGILPFSELARVYARHNSVGAGPRAAERELLRTVTRFFAEPERYGLRLKNFRRLRPLMRRFREQNPNWDSPEFWRDLSEQRLNRLIQDIFSPHGGNSLYEAFAVVRALTDLRHGEGNQSRLAFPEGAIERAIELYYRSEGIGRVEVSAHHRVVRNRTNSPPTVRYLVSVPGQHLIGRRHRDAADNANRVLSQRNVNGLDIVGTDSERLRANQYNRFSNLYSLLQRHSRNRNRPLVLRMHLGEGLTRVNNFQEIARDNIETVIRWLERLRREKGLRDFKNSNVIIRLAHLTHATPEQIRRLAQLGVMGESLLGPNVRTGVLATPRGAGQSIYDNHPFLNSIYHQFPQMFGTDSMGVMRTSIPSEIATANRIIQRFRQNLIAIRLPGSDAPRYYRSLNAEEKARFDNALSWLDSVARDYRRRMTQ